MNYAERIRDLREEKEIRQTQIAKQLNVAQTTYSDYEKGKVRIPVDILIKLAQFYNVDMNYITGITGIKHCYPCSKRGCRIYD